ncbi:MAG: sulfotransferase family protein [Paracoccaceae bacterium]
MTRPDSAPMQMLDTSDVVFVYGALRSGTTVFRLMLDAHPQIANPGEMDFLFDFLSPDPSHPTGWRYNRDGLALSRIFQSKALTLVPDLDGLDLLAAFLDQLRAAHPGQVLSINLHRGIDRVMALMPDVRVIHMLRDPRDVARSSIAMGWAGTLYHGVGHWLHTEADWDRGIPAGGRVHRLRFEDLFTDIDTALKEVCGFFDLPYDPQMLTYHENTTYGAPDPSLIQHWRKKADPAQIALLEHRARDMMTARGYPPEMPAVSPGAATMMTLGLRDKISKWRFGSRRYGAPMYWAEKITRTLRLKGPHRRLRQRMNRIEQALVK